MWELAPQSGYTARLRKWEKKHKRELQAVHDNLDTFLKALQRGQRPAAARFGFVHPEPKGVLAITQQGGGGHMLETRLYIYPHEVRECLYVITLGDKNTQQQDIQTCNDFVDTIRKEEATTTTSSQEGTHVQ
jgi:hypothetical protein